MCFYHLPSPPTFIFTHPRLCYRTSVLVVTKQSLFHSICLKCNTGVKDFMELLTLLAGRLPKPLSGRLAGDLRVMKEGIVVTKMLHGKYRQIWNE